MTQLQGKVAVVTGGASGIGKATAERLAAEGATVVVADLDRSGAERVAGDIGGTAVTADVGRANDWSHVVAAAESLGGLDIAFLNAGVTCGEADIAAVTDDAYRRIMGANVDGVVLGTRAVVPAMAARGGGHIVATASMAGLISFPPDPIYTMTKHAVVGFVRSLAPHLLGRGIHLNAVCPGIVDTPMLPDEVRPMLTAAGLALIDPAEIADAVVGCIAGGASGQCLVCQAGQSPEPFEFGRIPGLPF